MKNLELIEKYLNEELSGKELAEFEQLQKSDATFAEEVQMAVAVNADFNVQQKLRWQALLKAKETPIRQLTPQKRSINWMRNIAAVFILGLGLALSWMMFGGADATEMASDYLTETYDSPSTFLADNPEETQEDVNWGKAIKAYKAEDFNLVATSIEKSIAQNTNKLDEKYFYLGLSHLYNNSPNYDEAILNLEKSKSLNSERFGTQASWYLSLAHVKKGNNEIAKTLLQEVLNDTNDWKKAEATALLNQL